MKDLKTEFEVIVAGKDLNDLIDKFKLVNPTYYLIFKNTTQRKALERLVVEFGYEKVSKMIDVVAQCNGEEFAPSIMTPCELERKLGKLIEFYKRKYKIKESTKPKMQI